jgi:Radical SAM superfamily
MVPDRSGLPALPRYAHLLTPDGGSKVVGFAEASRGCKHLCRHCPVVPVYEGKFRVLPVEVVLQDIRQQVLAGAQHIAFGDPDFLNGPTHAVKIVRALQAEFPQLTYDVTIKVQHLLMYAELLPLLKETGCLFITSAIESVDDAVLEVLAKNHTNADFGNAVALTRAAGITLAPTFVPFTPWTTLEGYIDLLKRLVELELVESVPPIQLAIRLLVPRGSELLKLPGFLEFLGAFDPTLLGYPWQHRNSQVDVLQRDIQAWVAQAETANLPRREIFARIWELAHAAAGCAAPMLPAGMLGSVTPHLSEPWYCCAEPTDQQLQSF